MVFVLLGAFACCWVASVELYFNRERKVKRRSG